MPWKACTLTIAASSDRPRAGARPVNEGGDHPEGAVHAGEQVTDRYPDLHGFFRRGAGQRHQAGLTLGDPAIPGAASFGPVVTEPADGEQDESGVEVTEAGEVEPEPLENAGPEVLHQDVGALDETLEVAVARVGLEVELHGLPIAVGGQEIGRDGVVLGPDDGGRQWRDSSPVSTGPRP